MVSCVESLTFAGFILQMKEMLSRAVVLEKINIRRLQCTAIRPKNDSEDTCMPDGTSNVKAPHGSSLPKKRRSSEGMETVRFEDFRTLTSAKETTAPEAKRPKVVDFLGMGARKAKAARSARTAARVGVHQRCTKRLSHTGSGMPLTNVVRLKYVKGFTQAVRTPCRVEDLK